MTGKAEGLRSAPDGIFQTPAPFKTHEVLVERACAKLGIKATSARQAVITSPLNGRPACHYCGQCGRGCGTASNYASSYVQIFPAMKTGNVTVLTNSMARELITDCVGQGHRGVLHRQGAPAPSGRCGAAPSCSRRRRASPRGCCSTRSRRATRTASRTHTGMVGKYLTDYRRIRPVGDGALPARHADSQHRRLRRALVYPVVGRRTARQAGLSARLSRGSRRRRFRHAVPWIWCAGLRAERRVRLADEGRRSARPTAACRSA